MFFIPQPNLYSNFDSCVLVFFKQILRTTKYTNAYILLKTCEVALNRQYVLMEMANIIAECFLCTVCIKTLSKSFASILRNLGLSSWFEFAKCKCEYNWTRASSSHTLCLCISLTLSLSCFCLPLFYSNICGMCVVGFLSQNEQRALMH